MPRHSESAESSADHGAGRVAGLAQLAGPAQVLLEGDRVRLARHQVEHVAGPGRDQHPARAAQRPVGLDDPAQAGHVGIDAALGAGRRILAPDGIDELAPGNHAVRPHRQNAEYSLLPRLAHR